MKNTFSKIKAALQQEAEARFERDYWFDLQGTKRERKDNVYGTSDTLHRWRKSVENLIAVCRQITEFQVMLKSNHYPQIYQNEETGKWHYTDEASEYSETGYDSEDEAQAQMLLYSTCILNGQHHLFVEGYNAVANLIEAITISKGFRTRKSAPRNAGELIALMHAELSEGLEAMRKPGPSEHIPEFSGIEEELADTIIRIMDFGLENKLNIPDALIAKMQFNMTRPHKHGKKF